MSMRFTEIGQQLRAYRLESGLRAEEIAARLGVPLGTIKSRASLGLRKLARALGRGVAE